MYIVTRNSEIQAYSPFYKPSSPLLSTCDLVRAFSACWNPTAEQFIDLPFSQKAFRDRLIEHNSKETTVDSQRYYGKLAKRLVPPHSQIFVRGSLNGDLRSLLENLVALQKRGVLDANYKCHPNTHLVFLGNYGDGPNTMQIFELLLSLKIENREQVHLIRGTHEDIAFHLRNATDLNLITFLKTSIDGQLLDYWYQTMPLTLYITENNSTVKEYIQFTHGLFEPYIDPSAVLKNDISISQPVPRRVDLSPRLRQILKETRSEGPSRYYRAAQSVEHLVARLSLPGWKTLSAFTTGQVTQKGVTAQRVPSFSVGDIFSYLLSIEARSVKMIVRGNGPQLRSGKINNKVLVMTLPPSPINGDIHQDRTFLLTTAQKAEDWKNTMFTRERESSDTRSERTFFHLKPALNEF